MFFGYYTPILFLQAFCLYHAYSRNAEHKWLYLIIFLPLVGCLIYLYIHFFGNIKHGIGDISEGVKGLVNSNYKVEQLEREFNFADTVENKIRLAKAYTNKERLEEALSILKSCENGLYKDDPELLLQLLRVHYLSKNYTDAIAYGNKLKNSIEFKKSNEKIAYAWALHYEKENAAAEKAFQEMDMPFSNYKHRLEYSKFLLETKQAQKAKEKIDFLLNEIQHMDAYERKMIKSEHQEIKAFYNNILSAQ